MHRTEGVPATRVPSEKLSILLAIYAQLTSSALGYHSIVINVNVMCLSVNTFLVGYLIGTNSPVRSPPRHVLEVIPAFLAVAGICVTWVIRSHYQAIAATIRRIDTIFGAFATDYFAPGPALYPPAWNAYGSRHWHEVVFEIFIPLQMLMGTVGTILVARR
jgi:hypothetical protein